MTRIYKSILKRINVYFLIFSLNLIDILTIGSVLLTNKLKNLQNKSINEATSVLHLISLIFAQINFNTFTKLSIGVCSSIIVEASVLFSQFYSDFLEKYTEEKALINTLFVISSSTLLFGLISLFLSIFNVDCYIHLIPLEIVNGILAGSGLSMIFIGKSLFNTNDFVISNFMFVCILLVVFFIFYIEKKYPEFNFTPILVVLVFVLIYKTYKLFFPDKNVSSNNETNFVETLYDLINLDYTQIELYSIIDCFPQIISLTLFCLIFLPFHLTVFSKVTNVQVSTKKELRTQEISNIIGSVFCFPTYFVCSHTIFFYESGISSYFDSLILALCYCLIFFIADTIKSFVPIQILAIFPLMVGFSLCIPAIFYPKNLRNIYELVFTWTIAFLIGFNFPIQYVFLIGMIVSFIDYFLVKTIYTNSDSSNFDMHNHFSRFDYLMVDYPLFFLNINKFKNEIRKVEKQDVVIDLINCVAFDSLGNDVFVNNLLPDKMYYIIGKPVFLRSDELFEN